MKRISLHVLSFALAIGACATATAQNIYTFAGEARTVGYSGDGGYSTLADLNGPRGVATDASGNVYICDAANHVIRMVNTAGIIKTIAGNHTAGFSGDGGPATAAELNNPLGIAVDASGNVYFADGGGNRVRKITSSGIISTIAGVGTAGYSGDGGAATAAQLSRPTGLAVTSTGNVYIADMRNYVVRMINGGTGVITTVAGNNTTGYTGDGGPATAAELEAPAGLAIDASGNLYISDFQANVVRRVVVSTGSISTFAGTGVAGYAGDGGAATAADLNAPIGITFDGTGNLYIADYTNARIRKVTSAGVISTYAGNGTRGFYGDGGAATLAELNNPFGVAIFGTNNFYISDYGNNVVRRVGTPVRSITIASAHSDTVCAGGPVHFTATAYADANPHYQWEVNGVDVGTDSAGYTYTPATGDAIVCILDSAGTDFAISETLHVDTFQAAGIVLGPSTICIGTPVPYTSSVDTAGGGLGGPRGIWYVSNTTIATLTPPSTVTGTAAGSDTVFFVITNVCGSDSARLVINVVPATFGPISGPSQVCAGDTATFHDGTSGGEWTLGGGGGGGPRNTIDNTTGLFTAGRRPGPALIIYGTPGCVVTTTVTVIPTPRVAPITGPTVDYDGVTITLADTSAGGTWICGDTAVATVDGAGDVKGKTSGPVPITYEVTTGGCTGYAVTTVYVFATNSVRNVQGGAEFGVYPNPASGAITVSWSGVMPVSGELIISDITGHEVMKAPISASAINGKQSFDIESLRDGVYIITVSADNGYFTGKLVKQ